MSSSPTAAVAIRTGTQLARLHADMSGSSESRV